MDVGSIVLTGGRSRRMGRSKARLPVGNELMLQRIVRIIRRTVRPIVVVAAPRQWVPHLPADVRILRDRQENRGPLEGLAVGLSALNGIVDAAFVSSCDAPLLLPEFVCRMVSLLGDMDAVVPRAGDRDYTLSGVYRPALAPTAQELLEQGRRRVTDLLQACRTRYVSADELRDVDPDLRSLVNVNTWDDYRSILAELSCS